MKTIRIDQRIGHGPFVPTMNRPKTGCTSYAAAVIKKPHRVTSKMSAMPMYAGSIKNQGFMRHSSALLVSICAVTLLLACGEERRDRDGRATFASQERAQPMTVREAQAALKALGYEPGPVDGKMGKRTAAALRAFQQNSGQAVTGTITVETSTILREKIAKSPPRYASSGNEAHDLLLDSPLSIQQQAFRASVQRAGNRCPRITSTPFFKGFDRERTAYWAVRCSNGLDYLVAVHADESGSSRVLPCSVARALQIDCWTKF